MIKLLGLLLIANAAHATTIEAWKHNRAGVKDLNAKSYATANKEFVQALETDPLNPAVQMNLGLDYEANEEYDKALQAYKGVLQLVPNDPNLRFQALFNLAGAYAKLEKIDEALAAYQTCLEMAPDSLEVKTNIELLFQGGKGQGKGEGKDKGKPQEDKKDGRSNQEKREQAGPEPEQKKQPKPFQSQEMNKEDVKRILDEIKNQEQAIRANEYDKNAKEAPRGKDW